jgi:hypothetical protein
MKRPLCLAALALAAATAAPAAPAAAAEPPIVTLEPSALHGLVAIGVKNPSNQAVVVDVVLVEEKSGSQKVVDDLALAAGSSMATVRPVALCQRVTARVLDQTASVVLGETSVSMPCHPFLGPTRFTSRAS